MLAQFQDRLKSIPKIPPEDSVALRVLVQLLVSVGIAATDIAAADVTDRLNLVWWAIPLSFIGATVSYYRRRQRNIGLKFGIALGMLVSLGYFFVNLFSRSNDTRIVLVELLIQLQVLHSFDLPRRKDLGYSMMIGLILVASAATLSQTLLFGPFLFLFLAIALPILVLDYCSRLGISLTPDSTSSVNNRASSPTTSIWNSFKLLKFAPDLAPRRLSAVLLGVAALGLTVFALLPRLPGYQLRTFPVSAPIEVQGQFDNSQVFNPGYIADDSDSDGNGGEGDPRAVQGRGRSPVSGPGETDDEYYYGFNSQINQNLRGSLTPKVLMRVRSQVEGFWRVLSFDKYTGQGWEISRNDETYTLTRSPWNYRFELPATISSRSREVIQTYTIVGDLPNLLPALYKPTQVYFPTLEMAIDTEGGLRAPIPLSEGVTYTVVSKARYRDRAALAAAGQDYPDTLSRYFEVPDAIAPKLRQWAEEILATAPSEITSPYEKALYLTQAMKQRYTVQPELPFLAEDEDLAEAFLFKYKGGYPDHFSTALTLVLRSIGLPARLTAGFGPGEFNPFTGFYIVSNTDAYAMTEVFFPGNGWFAFDPIPGHPLVPPSVEENATFGTVKKLWQWVAGWLPSPVRNVFNGIFSFIGNTLGRGIGWLLALLTRDIMGLFMGLVLLTFLAFLGWLGWGQWRGWRRRRWLATLPPMESLYRQLLVELEQRGYPKRASQTPYEYVGELEQVILVQEGGDRQSVETATQISDAYVVWRYGGREGDVRSLEASLKAMQQGTQQSLWQRLKRQESR